MRGVLFDVDGTLVDSSYVHAVCWWQAFRQHDLDVHMSAIHRAVGMGSEHLVPHVLGDRADDVDADALSSAHAAIYSTWWGQLRAFPGARDLVRRCKEAGWTTVLASSAKGRELDVLRGVLGADEWIDAATSADDGDASKPSPDLVEVGLRKGGLDAADAVYVGDAVWDVQASAEAGLRCIGVESGGVSEAELREAGAVEVFQDVADVLAHWGSGLLR